MAARYSTRHIGEREAGEAPASSTERALAQIVEWMGGLAQMPVAPMALMGAGAGMKALGPEVMLTLRNLARQAAGKETISPQPAYAVRDALQKGVEQLYRAPYGKELTAGEYERILSTVGMLPPGRQAAVAEALAQANARLGTPEWVGTPVTHTVEDVRRGVIPRALSPEEWIGEPSMAVNVKHALRMLGGGQ